MKYRLELQRPVEGDSTFGSEPMKFIVTKKLASTSLTTP